MPARAQIQIPWKRCAGERPVCHLQSRAYGMHSQSHVPWEWSAKVGGKLHLKLHICLRPTANKYYEGQMQRTLKRELKVPEIAGREVSWTSFAW